MSSDDGVHPHRRRKPSPLGFAAVLALVFFEVSGGPFGIEDSVRYGGATLALLGLLVLPIVWSIPEALVTAELSTMFPEDSGYVAWVTAAFGPFWGFQEGWTSWLSGVIDNSIYPLFLARYLKWFLPILEEPIPLKYTSRVNAVDSWGASQAVSGVVGRMAVVLMVFILCPFVVLTGMGIQDVSPANWFSMPDPETSDIAAFINVMFWNLNYWDSIATLSGEIGNVGTVMPRALMTGVVLVCLTYLVPVLMGIGIWGSHDWPDGFFAHLGRKVGGVWLEGWVTLSAVASQMGLFTAELTSDAYMILGLAERGVLPKVLAHRSRYGTPTYALLMSGSGVIAVLVSFSFVNVVEMLNVAYCFAEMLEFLALLRLRHKMPDLPRPFRIPLELPGLCFMLLPSSLCVFIIVLVPVVTLDWVIMGFCLFCWSSGVALYYLIDYIRLKGYLDFNEVQPLDAWSYQRVLHESEAAGQAPSSVLGLSQLQPSIDFESQFTPTNSQRSN